MGRPSTLMAVKLRRALCNAEVGFYFLANPPNGAPSAQFGYLLTCLRTGARP